METDDVQPGSQKRDLGTRQHRHHLRQQPRLWPYRLPCAPQAPHPLDAYQLLSPLILAGVAALFLACSALTCTIPALRAASIDPMQALRAKLEIL
jgi:hypothetical protein